MVKRAPSEETTAPSAPAGGPPDPEVSRLLRPQPPPPIPPRTYASPAPGLLARALLGDRVHKRGG